MRKLIALLMALIIVMPLLLAAQAVMAASTFILDRDFYVEAIDSDEVYESLISNAVIWDAVTEKINLPPGTDTTRLQAVLVKAINHSTIRTQVNELVNEFFDYMQGSAEQFNPQLDITSVKSALSSDLQDEFLVELVAIFPVCEGDQLPQLDSTELALCKPAGIPDALLVENFLKPSFPYILAAMPDQVSLEEPFAEWQAQQQDLQRFVPGQTLPASMLLAVVVLACTAFGFWYLSALVAGSTWHVRLQWLGVMLFLPSALIFLAGLLIGTGISQSFIEFVLQRANLPLGPAFDLVFRAIVSGSIPRASSAFMMVGGISTAVALALFLWGWVLPRR